MINIIEKRGISLEIKEEKTKPEKVYEIGLSILRPILALFVVMTHCYNYNYASKSIIILYHKSDSFLFPVRVFFIMSFYFSYKTLMSSDYKKKYERFLRLIIPYFLWPIIFFYLDRILKYFIYINPLISFKFLIRQFLIGAPVIGPLWYQWNLIVISILVNVFVLFFKNHYNFIFIIISIVAFIYQYNGKNKNFVMRYDPDRNSTIGRFLEILPCCIIGFLIASSGIMNFFKKLKLKVFIACIFINYLIIKYDVFINISGFAYCGVKMFIVSICIFIGFAVFPSELIKNKIIIKIIKYITNYTAGVYYLHLPLDRYLNKIIIPIQKRTFKGCVINYIFCYFICFFGCLLFKKTRLRNLFQ